LTKGRIATVDGRFNGIRQVAPVCISLHLIHPSVGPPESTTQRHLDRFSHFCTAHFRVSSGMPGHIIPLNIASSHWAIWSPS